MTAIGLGLLLIVLAVGFFDDAFNVPDWCLAIASMFAIVGASLVAAGILVFVWKVMP